MGVVPSSLFILLLGILTTATRAALFRKKYNPVLFFKAPPGLIPACDEMEKCVRRVEKELGVKVERLDAARDPNVAALLSLKGMTNPPLLYHRESLQMVARPEKESIRALIKGRLLELDADDSSPKGYNKPNALLVNDEAALEQQELLEDQLLSPLQRKGKQAIRERTKMQGESIKQKP